VDFSTTDCIIGRPNPSNSLHFPPSSPAVNPKQAAPFADVNTDRDCSLLSDFSDELELHGWLLPDASR
jgi:hypothetical protein